MPHKIGFVVVSSSGHEDGFSAKELMVHAPTVNGWRSPRFCQFPQEIVLQMVERCRVRKLQLLAHQYMISSKIEFYISDSLPEYFAPYQAERFRRLGYVSLCDNEKTGCKARELKSVYVDAVGQFLKLIFHKNHVNRYNLYSQVALVAVNIIGDPADCSDESNISSREKLIDHYLGQSSDDSGLEGSYVGKPDYISPLDDLAFDMYQDPEVAHIIRRLDEKKREAVQKERYDHAKKLKQAIADLQKVGERLGRYDVEKRCAVEKEDYDLAKEKKQQMEQYRSKVYQQLQLHNLLDSEMIRKPFDFPLAPLVHSASPCLQKSAQSPLHREEQTGEKPYVDPFPPAKTQLPASLNVPPTQQAAVGQLSASVSLSKINVDLLPYDERPLPAVLKQQGETNVEPEKVEEDVSMVPKGGIAGEPEPLTEKALREASSAIEVLGEALVAGAYSKTWSYREDALLSLYNKIMTMPVGTSKEDLKNLLRAAIFLIRRAIKDLVPSELALCKEIKPLQIIPTYLVQPLKQNSSTHLAMSQTDLLARLLKDLGTESSGFTVDNVMRFSVSALEHRIYEIREIAVKIILDMYKKHRTLILEYLPADDGNARKNILYKTLFEGFAKIDGKAVAADSRAQKKAATEQAEKQKKEEIKVLQVQLAALREIQAEAQIEKDKESDTRKEKNQDDPQRKAVHPNAPDIPDDHPSVANYLDFLCIFCGERDDSFTEEGLDLHYWKHCPMLTRCEHCKQVVEIASLTEHLLTECDKRDEFGKCHRCCEAVLKEELPKHIKIKACNPARSEKLANRCPLCHENFTPGEEAWKSHLTGPAGCTMNLRKAYYLQKTQAMQLGKAVDSVMAKSGTSGSTFGSKIPTPKGGLNKSSSRAYTKR
ncbi:centrosomal protein of 104 kDa isoform X2 [Phascolarctos cinereus]